MFDGGTWSAAGRPGGLRRQGIHRTPIRARCVDKVLINGRVLDAWSAQHVRHPGDGDLQLGSGALRVHAVGAPKAQEASG
jgi:hypothetical protein